jgi:RNA polymerase sigma factor (TIGR02999 family)
MRRILIENARRRNAEKRGGGMERVELREDEHAAVAQPESLIELDAALSRLAQVDPELVRVVELRYFTGFTVEQTALALGLSERTIKRHWAYARAWLARELSDDPS